MTGQRTRLEMVKTSRENPVWSIPGKKASWARPVRVATTPEMTTAITAHPT